MAPKFWRSDQLNGIEYNIEIQGVGLDGNDIDEVYLPLCSGCPATEEGCYWECVSSTYAYRIQMYDGTFNNYRLELARETDLEGAEVPYYEWFSATEFLNYVTNPSSALISYRSMPNFHPLDDYINEPPFFMVNFPADEADGVYRNSVGEIIEGEVYGIQKGLGPWYVDNSETIEGITGDYCNMAGGAGEASFATIVSFFNNESDVSSDLECDADLGASGYYYGGEEYEYSYTDWVKYTYGVKYGDGEYGDDGEDGDGSSGIVVEGGNWTEFVADVFNFTMDDFDDPDLRYSEMLMNCQLFSVSKL